MMIKMHKVLPVDKSKMACHPEALEGVCGIAFTANTNSQRVIARYEATSMLYRANRTVHNLHSRPAYV